MTLPPSADDELLGLTMIKHRNDVFDAAITAAKASGCTCRPEAGQVRSDDGIPRVEVRHDAWCPMIDHCTQLVIQRLPGV